MFWSPRSTRRAAIGEILVEALRNGAANWGRSKFGPVLSPARRPGSMPAEATSFVGRRRELAEARKKLAAARLISLTGPGGVGETRLAVRIATGLGRGFRAAPGWPSSPSFRIRRW